MAQHSPNPDPILRLGFGCGGLMREASRRKRADVLAATFDAGIRHFDVARMYGLGAAEAELGRFARGRRDELTIATKFGIEASTASWMARLQGPARRLLDRYPALRRAVKRRDAAFHHPGRYDVATARESLDRSLAELGTDYVDILFIHDPPDADGVPISELREFLEGARQAGKIRAWGVAGEPGPVTELAALMPDDAVLQMRDDIFARDGGEPEAGQRRISFGILSSALDRVTGHVAGSESDRRRWLEAVGADCVDPEVVASLLLRDALEANPDGVVLFNTTKPAHLRSVVAAAYGGSPLLSAFQELVLHDVGAKPAVGETAVARR